MRTHDEYKQGVTCNGEMLCVFKGCHYTRKGYLHEVAQKHAKNSENVPMRLSS
jgi:hypothetical protein